MTDKLEAVIESIKKLPAERQDELAEAISHLSGRTSDSGHTEVQIKSIHEGLAEAEAGNFVSEEEVTALLSKYEA